MNPELITYFAKTDYRNKQAPFGIKSKDRSRHMYVIGKTGMGKSTLLENMAIQDIRNGEGFAFVDPHGKSAELLLDYVPQERINDVMYFAPFDMDYPIAFNVMEDVGYDKRHLVVNGLMSAFKKIWVDAWSARMEYILQNTLLALLEYPGATMLGVNRMYTDKEYRKKVVGYRDTKTGQIVEGAVKDPLVRSFWLDEFATFTDTYTREATPAIQNKVGQFTGNPLIRNIIGQSKSTFDLRAMMDKRKIVIVNLSKGKVGEGNANLLGSMLITKIYLAAMSRADVSEVAMAKLPDFYLYVDEFQSFANESFADILSEARKYKLNLLMAHQYIEQMSEEMRAAVFGNVGTMAAFRVGAFDAEVLEKEFAPKFTAIDLVNLGFAQIYLKLMIDSVASQPFSALTLPPISKPAVSFKEVVIEHTRRIYARPREEIEEEITRLQISRRMEFPEENPKRKLKEEGERQYNASFETNGASPQSASRRNTSAGFSSGERPVNFRSGEWRDEGIRRGIPVREDAVRPIGPKVAATASAGRSDDERQENRSPVYRPRPLLPPEEQRFQLRDALTQVLSVKSNDVPVQVSPKTESKDVPEKRNSNPNNSFELKAAVTAVLGKGGSSAEQVKEPGGKEKQPVIEVKPVEVPEEVLRGIFGDEE